MFNERLNVIFFSFTPVKCRYFKIANVVEGQSFIEKYEQ